MRCAWVAIAALALAAGEARAQDSLPVELRQARDLIAAGKIEDAIHVAEAYTFRHPRDERGFLALGDAWFKHMPIGRFKAALAYEEAERLAPQDPEPPYRYAQVGLWLLGDDGERMAAEGLERVLTLDPLYRDAWEDWLTAFRNAGSRRHMEALLEPHRSNPVIRSRLALLAVEDERYEEADQLLDSALVTDSSNTAWLALRAQSAFEAGDTASGWLFYSRALAHADLDSTDALWRQVIGIARPYEVKLWEAGVPPARRRAWLASFWARRNPNLFAGVNGRVAEHFARLRYARKHYPLLHPMVSYQRSEIARTMNMEPSAGEREYYTRCEMYEVLPEAHPHLVGSPTPVGGGVAQGLTLGGMPIPGVASAGDENRVAPGKDLEFAQFTTLTPEQQATVTNLAHAVGVYSPIPAGFAQALFVPLNLDLRSMDSVATRIGYNLATGLDDRGVLYLRFGPPEQQFIGGKNTANPDCSVPDVERWKSPAYGEVRFARPNAFSRGERLVPDMVFRAMNEHQFLAAETGLTNDESSEPAALEFGVWTAQFADSADTAATDLVVVSTRGEVAAALDATSSPGEVSVGGGGVTTVHQRPGSYVLVAQARDSGALGRLALAIALQRFDRKPALSELLIAPAWDSLMPDRAAMLQHLRRTLVFDRGATIRSYAELYGLRQAAGAERYEVRYELLHTDEPGRDIHLENWPRATRFLFVRERRASLSRVEIETLDIAPSDVPPGRYLLRVRVHDLVADADAGRATISFVVR